MPRVNIRYEDGSTVDANNLGDALVHLVTQGTGSVVDVVEETVSPGPCKHCDGTGSEPAPKPKRVLTRRQAEDKVAQVNEELPPVADVSFDDRVKLARSLAED
jgi:hypothetical protein